MKVIKLLISEPQDDSEQWAPEGEAGAEGHFGQSGLATHEGD